MDHLNPAYMCQAQQVTGAILQTSLLQFKSFMLKFVTTLIDIIVRYTMLQTVPWL